MEDYITTLTALGKPPLWLDKVCVLPFSGRVMGLYPQEGLNALWVSDALGSATSAQALLTGGGWTNLGGDRTWVSPEFDLFVSDASRPWETYKVPAGLDPAAYRVVSHCADTVELETAMSLDFYRSGGKGEMSLRKRITELDAPGFSLPAGVSAAGYELTCTLSATGALPPSARPAIWNLLQVPGGGDIVIPVKDSAAPVAFFGHQQWRQDGQRIVASVPVAPDGYKFGVLAGHCRGLMLYLNLTAPQPFVILRRFSVGSQDQYFDVPFTDPQRKGFVQQVYVDNGAFGGFGEMEHHSPAIVPGQCSKVTDTCTTWAFAGPTDKLRGLGELAAMNLNLSGVDLL
jgi:hypothetical protein